MCGIHSIQIFNNEHNLFDMIGKSPSAIDGACNCKMFS